MSHIYTSYGARRIKFKGSQNELPEKLKAVKNVKTFKNI